MTRVHVYRSLVIVLLAACGSDKPPVGPPKRPATELIVGEFERRPPDGTTAIRFRADGSVVVAHERAKLDRESLASGAWKLDGDQLTLSYDKGMCADGSPGVYKVVVSKIGVHFGKVEDRCDQRAKIDNQTWWRIR